MFGLERARIRPGGREDGRTGREFGGDGAKM
jgi:hypothetical protein